MRQQKRARKLCPATLKWLPAFYPQRGSYHTLVVYHLIRKPGWSTGVVNGKRQNPNGNFHTGFAVPFTVPSDPIRKAWNWSERANGTHNFRLGMFVHLSRNPVFPGNFPFGKTKLVFPFTFQPKFPDFFL